MEKAIFTPAVATDNGFTGAFDGLRTRYGQYMTYRRTVRELSSLSDRALSDLGLSRSMIKGLAREAAYGR